MCSSRQNISSVRKGNLLTVMLRLISNICQGTSLKFIFCILFQTLSLDPSAMNLVFELSPDSEFWNTLKSLHGFLLELFRDKNPFVSHQMMGRLVRVWSVLCLRAIEKGVSLERLVERHVMTRYISYAWQISILGIAQ